MLFSNIIAMNSPICFIKKQIIKFGYHFLLFDGYGVYLLMKKNYKTFTHFGDIFCKK